MNKTEIIGELAARTNITQAQSGDFVNAILDILTEHLEKHEKVSFLGFGIFEAKAYSERVARNPRTKETVTMGSVTESHGNTAGGFLLFELLMEK